MVLVLLPGLDGTGILFEPFLECLPQEIETKVISYPCDEELSYEELVQYVRARLPEEDFVLLAESFSGPIAFLLVQTSPENLKSIIFVASFLSTPHSGILKMIRKLPLFSLPIPKVFIKYLLMGNHVNDRTINLFNQSLKRVPASVLMFRLNQIEKLNLYGEIKDLPCTYIQAKNDKLVLSTSIEPFKEVINGLSIFLVEGSHFILQTQPKICADFIAKKINPEGVRND